MANIYNMADTWNAGATTFTAIKMNVTDTASAAASLLMDLQVGGTSKANIGKTGTLTLNGVSSVGAKIVSTAQFRTAGFMIGGDYQGGSSIAVFDSGFSTGYFAAGSNGAVVSGTRHIGFAATVSATPDIAFTRSAAGVVVVTNGSTGAGSMELIEQTAPSAPSADRVRIYAQDNGAGKTQLMALFSSGAAQQIAIQP